MKVDLVELLIVDEGGGESTAESRSQPRGGCDTEGATRKRSGGNGVDCDLETALV